jgi:hypothetical protein
MHTDTTLEYLELATTSLGTVLRRFVRTTCEAFVTKELPREAEARKRRKPASTGKKANTDAPTSKTPEKNKRKLFSLSTYKLHALGDYAETIRHYGTSDSYSTQIVRVLALLS